MSAMVCLLLMFAAALMEHADGRPALPPLPVKGDHIYTGSEMPTSLSEGELKQVECFPPNRRLLCGIFRGGTIPSGR